MVESLWDAFTDIFTSFVRSGDKSVLTINFSFSHKSMMVLEIPEVLQTRLMYTLIWELYLLIRPSCIISSKNRRWFQKIADYKSQMKDAPHQSLAGARILIK